MVQIETKKIHHFPIADQIFTDDSIPDVGTLLIAGHGLPNHFVYGPVLIQCVEGMVEVMAHGTCKRLCPGDLMYLAGEVHHDLLAIVDASVLVCMVRQEPEC